ncbi:acyltransferase family protein [Sphingorhabdus sp. Alg231-15]|uniref:acyltransferase family protein n=1 Tax=Sphingorhabdus sp. Alg231-15 TaxID=1922222 RepID=UPI00307BCBD5
MPTGKRKIHSIQFLRFVAATLVVLFHAHLALSKELLSSGGDKTQLYLFGFGAVGVHIFFVISGYIMVLTNSQANRAFDAKRFFRKRIIRIYPIYWLLAALYILVNTAIGSGYEFSLYNLISALLLLPDNAPLIIGPAWTLSYEMYFYLMFGIAMIFGLLRGIFLLSAFFFLAMAFGVIVGPENESLAMATNSLLIEFLFGVWIAYITGRNKLPKWLGYISVLLSIMLFSGGLLAGYESLPSAIIWGIPSAFLIMGVVILEHYHQPAFVEKLSPLGDSSYTLYLAHILIITLLVLITKAVSISLLPILLLTAIFTIIAITVSHLFHLYVEAPMTNRLNKWFGS